MRIPTRFLLLFLLPCALLAETFQRSEVESTVTPQGAQIDRFTIYSPSMKRDIKAVVVLPPAYLKEDSATYPILYTLHGHNAPYDTFASMPKLIKELQTKPFIFTCFDGDIGSNYIDAYNPIKTARKGQDQDGDEPKVSLFNTFFFDEFIPAIDSWYRVNPDKRAVTGFSMGGGGAITYGLTHPEMFTSISGLSTAFLDLSDPDSRSVGWMKSHLGPYGEYPERYAALDHYNRIEKHLANGTKLPPIYQYIGTEDFLLENNHKFKAFAEGKGLDFTYEESPGGHNWKFWHPASVKVAEFHWEHFQD